MQGSGFNLSWFLAQGFFARYHCKQESFHEEELVRLKSITVPQQMLSNEIVELFGCVCAACMCGYMCACVCVECGCGCEWVGGCVMDGYVCMHVCVHVCVLGVDVGVGGCVMDGYVCMHVCVHVCVCVCVCACVSV